MFDNLYMKKDSNYKTDDAVLQTAINLGDLSFRRKWYTHDDESKVRFTRHQHEVRRARS